METPLVGSTFSSYTIAVSIAAAAVISLFYWWWTLPTPTHEGSFCDDQAVLRKFKAFAELSQSSYGSPSLNARPPSVQIGQWHFSVCRTCLSGKIWVWKCEECPNEANVDYVVVIRGSHTVKDWLRSDLYIAMGTATFVKVLEEYVTALRICFEEMSLNGNTNMMFCGHSLGGSIAEALHFRNGKVRLYPGVSSVGCVSFDSPGQPAKYRSDSRNGFLLQSSLNCLWTLNARPNVVNMLYPPISKKFYSCGLGSQLHFSDLGKIPCASLKMFVMGLWDAFFQSTKGHSLDDIMSYLRSGEVRRESPEDWPVYSGKLLQRLHIQEAQQRQQPTTTRHTWDFHPAEPENENRPKRGTSILPDLPANKDGVSQGQPYKVSNYAAFNTFFSTHGDRCALIPFISISGQGKTHTVAKLLNERLNRNLNGSALKECVRDGTRNSIHPIVVLWKTVQLDDGALRVYIIDFPGIGEDERSLMRMRRGFDDLLRPIVHNVVGVYVILHERMHETAAPEWASLRNLICSCENLYVTFAFNASSDLCHDSDALGERWQHYTEEFRKKSITVGETARVTYCALRSRCDDPNGDNFCIQDLSSRLDQEVQRMAVIPIGAPASSRSWVRTIAQTAVTCVPVVGPLGNALYHGMEGDYFPMCIDSASAIFDVVSLGSSAGFRCTTTATMRVARSMGIELSAKKVASKIGTFFLGKVFQCAATARVN